MLEQFKNGEEPKKGPQIDRNVSEGPQGRTSLHKLDDILPIDRDFDAAKKEWEDAKAAAAAKAEAAKAAAAAQPKK